MSCARLFLGWLWLLFALGPVSALGATTVAHCPVCGMAFKQNAKTAFETVRDGKPIQLDSFACASRFYGKSPKAPLWGFDFESGKKLDAKDAWLLIKSHQLTKELDLGMPPSVAVFETEAAAKKKQKALGDGEVVHGFAAARKAYE